LLNGIFSAGLSRPQANELVKKFVDIGLLAQIERNVVYGREFWYKDYLDLFISAKEARNAAG
jgi:hypothetical protein